MNYSNSRHSHKYYIPYCQILFRFFVEWKSKLNLSNRNLPPAPAMEVTHGVINCHVDGKVLKMF